MASTSSKVDIKALLEAGAHFGHKTERWHPKMAPYIYTKRNGIHIIDLTKTAANLERALDFITKVASEDKQILLVGTKRQAKPLIKETADEVNMPYVIERWLGGMLTNWKSMSSQIKRLQNLENQMADGELANKYNKLEVQRFQEEIDHLNHIYGGVKELNKKPGAIFIIDVVHDANAVKEANKLGIPIVALVDTNADPSLITYPIPSNDDAIKGIKLVLDYVKQAINDGKAKIKAEQPKVKETK